MNAKNLIEKARKLANHFRITNGEKFSLKHIDPRETLGLKSEDKPRTKEELATAQPDSATCYQLLREVAC